MEAIVLAFLTYEHAITLLDQTVEMVRTGRIAIKIPKRSSNCTEKGSKKLSA